MALSVTRRHAAVLAGSCALCWSLVATPPRAEATTPPAATSAASTEASKDSPYAAAKDETGAAATAPAKPAPVLKTMEGTKAPGTEKESPYAAAKDELAPSFGPTLSRLWWLLLPTGLAAGSYFWLRSQEGAS
jgi:hypothetical protein